MYLYRLGLERHLWKSDTFCTAQDGEGDATDPLESRQLARCFLCIPSFLRVGVKGAGTALPPAHVLQLLELVT
jgi:hypothetical protein